ncbi:MAG TPA: cell envelope integrity protein TolA, partial [Nitrospirae bacterium]|nr:cell envelope integrity protein TolA [Nitrospirota bacterium]
MREPSLKETAVLSLILHALVFFTALLLIKKTSLVTLPSPYMVRLVSPAKVIAKKTKATVSTVRTKKKVKTKTEAKVETVRNSRPAKVAKKKAVPVKKAPQSSEGVTLEERIAAIRAKKRIRTVVALRKTVLSVKKEQKPKEVQPPAREDAATSEGTPGGGDSLMAGYYSLVQERVWSEWVFPEFRTGQGLEAVVDIKIYRNGRVKIQGIKKSSGNTLFDRSVLRAISKASPLPP